MPKFELLRNNEVVHKQVPGTESSYKESDPNKMRQGVARRRIYKDFLKVRPMLRKEKLAIFQVCSTKSKKIKGKKTIAAQQNSFSKKPVERNGVKRFIRRNIQINHQSLMVLLE